MTRTTVQIVIALVDFCILVESSTGYGVRQVTSMAFGPVRVRAVSELNDQVIRTFVKGFWGENLSEAQITRLGNDVQRDLSVRYRRGVHRVCRPREGARPA